MNITLEQFVEKVADSVGQRIEKHGEQPLAIYAVSRQGREYYQEFPVDIGLDKDEIDQKMRDWIDRKHIVRYARVAEGWASDTKNGPPSQQLNKKEVVTIEATDKATHPISPATVSHISLARMTHASRCWASLPGGMTKRR